MFFLLALVGVDSTAQEKKIVRPGIEKVQVPVTALHTTAAITLGGTPDWLAISEDSVWVSNAKLKAVQRIDAETNSLVATIPFDNEPCSGLVYAFGSVWVPLCGKPAALARIDPKTNSIKTTLPFGPADSEGGIAASDDSIWLVSDATGTLLRIDPETNSVRQKIAVPAGSFNPLFSDGFVWITGNKSSALTPVDARTGAVLPAIPVGPQPRFLVSGSDSIWTLNQGDGTITRVHIKTRRVIATIPAGIPGPGGDICYGADHVWATVFDIPLSMISPESNKVLRQWTGPGGDALRFGHHSLWLTDYRAGLLLRLSPPTL